MTRILYTEGQGHFTETKYDCPKYFDSGIIVKNIMTGVCRSDIDMMTGQFGPLPLDMQGHEGLGEVISVGDNCDTKVKKGDLVATRGEPAYADSYPVRNNEFVLIPEALPKYIIEPVACGLNVVMSYTGELTNRAIFGDRICLIGSGFLSYVAYTWLKHYTNIEVDIVGTNNKSVWSKAGVNLQAEPGQDYGVIIDLHGGRELFLDPDIIENNGLLIEGTSRNISKKENDTLLWKSITTLRPSPRNKKFKEAMNLAVDMIKNNELDIDSFWTRSYNRDSEWQQAFADGLNRPTNYSRGYIVWQ